MATEADSAIHFNAGWMPGSFETFDLTSWECDRAS